MNDTWKAILFLTCLSLLILSVLGIAHMLYLRRRNARLRETRPQMLKLALRVLQKEPDVILGVPDAAGFKTYLFPCVDGVLIRHEYFAAEETVRMCQGRELALLIDISKGRVRTSPVLSQPEMQDLRECLAIMRDMEESLHCHS